MYVSPKTKERERKEHQIKTGFFVSYRKKFQRSGAIFERERRFRFSLRLVVVIAVWCGDHLVLDRSIVVYRVLVVGRSAMVRPSAPTDDTWLGAKD